METPLEAAPKISEPLGTSLFLKREDLQPVFSFKLRGAYNKMAHLSADQLAKGVICSSAGNHAQGVALSAAKLVCGGRVCVKWLNSVYVWCMYNVLVRVEEAPCTQHTHKKKQKTHKHTQKHPYNQQGCEATVCMPTTTPDIKVNAVKRLGGHVELVGESYQETQAYAQVCCRG